MDTDSASAEREAGSQLDLKIVDLDHPRDTDEVNVGAKSGGSSGCGYWVGESDTPASTR